MRCSLLFAAVLLLLQQVAVAGEPQASNPYAGKSYGSCPGNYCESEDPALELQLWEAARTGDVKTVKQLLANDKLNLTRNVVPDDDGLARVVDVAVWVASEQGKHKVMRAILEHLPKQMGVPQIYRFEDGHILDLAAANGDLEMVQLLLEFNMTVGPSAMAHAAHFNHTDVMKELLTKPMDLKNAMQAISNGGSQDMAQLLLKAMKDKAIADKEHQSHGAYDWHGDYVMIAVTSGNVPVLTELLSDGYELKWQQAQDLIKACAEQGSPVVMELLLSQKLFSTDKDELDEAVDTALKASAELGKPDIVEVLLKKFPEETKGHCKAGVFRALKYGQDKVVKKLAAVCPVDVSKSTKLQDAQWIGQVLSAARTGDAAAMKALLAQDRAKARIRKLHRPVEEDASGDKKEASGPAIDPKHDPLVIAAVNGHLEVVKQLEALDMLCSPCAASAASKANQTEVIKHLVSGTGRILLQQNEDFIQDALRVVAYSMEQQNWGLVEWFLGKHVTQDLGSYFLPVIAQEGKLSDMKAMIGILKARGRTDNDYFKAQVHSAMISAALGGHLDLLLELKQYSDPQLYVQPPAGTGGDDDYDESVDDKTEL